ncbi:topoisomerase DNA-binding C4 zinc finger domain-containing protein [Oscillospiraceae bacterium OttesenSCG-928-G22]|nr:topoisomerase DNA-binding C4 zinc finger domain-containing protein [Oscillospiraceae bacterium OttesenSCG-928-G22]
MKAKQLNLVYALKDEALVHISEVESGLRCGCICPSCNARLVARKGAKVIHHFAHHQSDSCQHGYETSLHMAAKEIIANAKRLWLPAVYLNFDSGRSKEMLSEASEVEIEDVKLENAIDDIIPDIIVTASGKSFIIEIYVTHTVDDIKLAKIKRMNLSTLEIDLSKKDALITKDELRNVVLNETPDKQWRYNAFEELWKKRFLQACEQREIVARGYALHIDNCPIAARTWRSRPYANFTDDCTGCKFFIAHGRKPSYQADDYNGSILCSGAAGIGTVQDFSLSLDERRKKYITEQEHEKTNAIASGRCPNCGGELKQRKGKYGEFWGCGNYPHCRFTLNIDPETGEVTMKA